MITRTTITILLLLLSGICHAQYIFTNLQKRDGVSTNEVYCSFKDSEGFMWFGTANGLNRYDGAGFKNFNQARSKYSAVGDVVVNCMAGKDNTQIWVGSNKGLFIFNKVTETFTSIPLIYNGKPLANQTIGNVFYDHLNRLWVVTAQNLFVVNNNQAVAVAAIYKSAALIDNLALIASGIKADSLHNGLWISTFKGLFFLDFKTGDTWSHLNNPHQVLILDSTLIYSLAVDGKGEIWLSNDKSGLLNYNVENKRFSSIKLEGISRNYGIYIDKKGRLWLQNYTGKITVVENDGRLTHLPYASPENYTTCNSFFYSIYEDDENNLWIAGLNGISKLAKDNYIENIIILPGNLFNSAKIDYQVNDIYEAGGGNLWMCKDDGLYLFDVYKNETKRYGITAEKLQPNRFFDIQLINGEWWSGTGNGIKIFNPVTKQFRAFEYYPAGHDLKNISCTWLHQDKKGMVWFACWSNAVYRFDPATKQTLQIKEIRSTEPGNPVLTASLCVFENDDGKLWIGNGTKGVMIYDSKTETYKPADLHGDIVVNTIGKDDENNIWLATTGRGILKTDANGKLVDSITVTNGLSISAIYKIIFDKTGRLWCNSSEGIQYVNTSTKTVSKLSLDMGLPAHDPNGALFLLNDKLYASAVNKVAIINLAALNNSTRPAAPLISGIRVFEKDIPYASSNPALHLAYTENFFSIDFSVLNHKEISSIQYAYKLKGFDKDWVYCGRRQTAAYTNVPDGHYTFLVKCTDANGRWVEKETAIEVYIKPPFWKTTSFTAGILSLLVLLVWYLYKLSVRRKQKKYIDNTIDYFANSVYGQNSVTEICWDIARNCISQLKFEDCVVYLFDKEKNRLVQKAAYGPKNPRGHEIINPIEIELGQGVTGTVAATGKALLVNDTTKEERYVVDDEVRLSELAVPVFHDNKVIGVIDSEHTAKNFFTEEHLKALSTIAAISANKIAEAIAEAQAKENEIKVLEINKMLAESQLMALRAQMNPHFVFNCLNSIQECIVTQKYGEASRYLNKFSKLFRMVLNNSGKKLVTIAEEKEVLELYLQLELMRFEQSFEYKITVDEALDANEVLIPSMLAQPFVENALWHGLMHKKDGRKLDVKFNMLNDEIFECTIEDNGIGRKRSFELKAGQSKSKQHESKGLAISKDRIDVLKKQGYHAALQIIDKEDENGNAAGTKIVIELSTGLIN